VRLPIYFSSRRHTFDRHEAENQRLFREELLSRMGKDVYVPKVYNDLTTRYRPHIP